MRSRAVGSVGMSATPAGHPPTPSSLSLPQVDAKRGHDFSSTSRLIRQRNFLAVVCLFQASFIGYTFLPNEGSLLPTLSLGLLHRRSFSASSCQIDLGRYRGPVYDSPASGTLGQPKCLLSSKWMQVSLHTVRFPGTDVTYDDWLWIDYHDRINVVVEDERGQEALLERRFLVFEQTKYALEGRSSLAIIGGIIEPGEDPEQAARREVEEEMGGLTCANFHFLGRYRSDVNRGVGWLNSFLATDCSRRKNRNPEEAKNGNHPVEEVGAADTEEQKLKSISLAEFREAALHGKFLEVQWTTTVAQALLHPELAGA